MRAIVKGPEPRSLTAHRRRPHCDYDNYADKAGLRRTLVAEQRGLCCYCMGRIRDDRTAMKIEHWRCQRRYPGRELEYRNLLAACLGGEGQPAHKQHCDTRKGDRDLLWNPADPDHHVETRIDYGRADGRIWSDDDRFNEQLEDVLNLNCARLKNGRKRLLDGILDWWRHEKARLRGPVPRVRFERERERRSGGSGELTPYSQVAVWWIERRLASMPA